MALPWATAMTDELGGEPKGNGEDIVLSYSTLIRLGHSNWAYKLPYENMGYDDQHAISVRYPGHMAHSRLLLT